MAETTAFIDMVWRNYVTVTLCIGGRGLYVAKNRMKYMLGVHPWRHCAQTA